MSKKPINVEPGGPRLFCGCTKCGNQAEYFVPNIITQCITKKNLGNPVTVYVAYCQSHYRDFLSRIQDSPPIPNDVVVIKKVKG